MKKYEIKESDKTRKFCIICGGKFLSFHHNRKYCSMSCAGKSQKNVEKLKIITKFPRKKRDKKIILRRKCEICGSDVFKYKKQTCSKKCSDELHSIRNKRDRIPNKKCYECGKEYHTYQKERMYCSYPCHIKSGGAVRAGQGNINRMKKYGAKKDINHNELVAYLEMNGCFVKDLSGAGFGVPDIIFWLKDKWILAEIKNPNSRYGKKGLNENQKKWAQNWNGGAVYVLKTIEDCKNMINDKSHLVEHFPKEK